MKQVYCLLSKHASFKIPLSLNGTVRGFMNRPNMLAKLYKGQNNEISLLRKIMLSLGPNLPVGIGRMEQWQFQVCCI